MTDFGFIEKELGFTHDGETYRVYDYFFVEWLMMEY